MTVSSAKPGTGPNGRRPTTRGSQRSAQIIQAAANLFQDAGYQNVSIDDIGSAVGLTGPAVYRHFKGKHDILVHTLIGQVELVEDMARRAAEGEGAPDERMAAFLAELEDLAVHRDEAMLWRRERRHLQPAERGAFRAEFGRVQRLTRAAIAASRPDSSAGQLELLSLALLSLFGNTREIRAGLDESRLAAVQSSIAWAVVRCALPAEHPGARPAATQTERMPAGRRERIIAASADLFDSRGFYDVRVDDIAKAAGISGATLYQLFPNKTQILQAILERGAEGLLYITAEALAHAETPDEVLETLVRTYIEQALGLHGRTMRILVTDAIYLSGEVQQALRESQREYVNEWIDALCALHPNYSAADARAVALSIISVITDLSQTRRIRTRPDIHEELRTLARAMMLSEQG
ncbi:TetR/AcrR family transcriptional regulator [Nocardia miyunensis]|uniref:TetR/AcrR family transcriptional regulator n=1 Tax=Nocardia miyunensis TaxID=282684 RepID=UPI00082A68D8|nr:TetR/AcrR family transcriptional regulator [Nocardia miyunensis]